MRRKLIHWLGLLGPFSLLSYIDALVFSLIAYPGYKWIAHAVSDSGAQEAPSQMLMQQSTSIYDLAGIISITLVCIFIKGRLNKTLRVGIYLFGIMHWISAIGYVIFPLTASGSPQTLQDMIQVYNLTALVRILSILSFVFIMVGGFKSKRYKSLALWAMFALVVMLIGAITTDVAPAAYFSIPERFSVFSVTAFNAVLGLYLFNGFGEINPVKTLEA